MRNILFILIGMTFAVNDMANATEQNLLSNPDFDNANKIAGWTPFGRIQWSSDDAANNTGSGSLELNMDEIVAFSRVEAACFHVIPGAAYSFSGQAKVIPSTFGLEFDCTAYSDANCTQFITRLNSLGFQPVGTSWATLSSATGKLPINANTVQCGLIGEVSPSEVETSVWVDNLYFDSAAPVTPVRLQSFNVE